MFQSNKKVEQGLEQKLAILKCYYYVEFQSNKKVEQGLELRFKRVLLKYFKVSIQQKSRARFRAGLAGLEENDILEFQSNKKVEQGLESTLLLNPQFLLLMFQSNKKVEQGLEELTQTPLCFGTPGFNPTKK